jgi:hypothetical protein
LTPTAHSFAARGNLAAPNSSPLNTPLESTNQAVPFQRRIIACSGPPLMLGRFVPTANTSFAERAATPLREGYAPGVGLGTIFHALPFHCSISVLPPGALVAPVNSPTAQASVGEMAVTDASVTLDWLGGWATETADEALPL